MSITRPQLGALLGIESHTPELTYQARGITLLRAERDGWLAPSLRSGVGAQGPERGARYNVEDCVVALAITGAYPIVQGKVAQDVTRRRVTLAHMVRDAIGHRWLCFSEDDAVGTDDPAEVVAFMHRYGSEVTRCVPIAALLAQVTDHFGEQVAA